PSSYSNPRLFNVDQTHASLTLSQSMLDIRLCTRSNVHAHALRTTFTFWSTTKSMNSSAAPAAADQQALTAVRQRLIDSGALGRSSVYLNLLDYLLNCAQQGKQPKEFEIAVDVLHRDSNFDVAKDSVVRVYVHQLRKRLDHYFTTVDPNSPLKLSIPKGQYTVVISYNEEALAQAAEKKRSSRQLQVKAGLLYVLIAVLLVF